MYSKEDIIKARETAKRLGLDMCEEFWTSPIEYLQEHCNGVGSKAMLDIAIRILDFIYEDYIVTAMGHDLDYLVKHVSKKTADKRFYNNMLIIWRAKFGWKRFGVRGLRDFFRIRAAYVAVRDFGQKAWEEAG